MFAVALPGGFAHRAITFAQALPLGHHPREGRAPCRSPKRQLERTEEGYMGGMWQRAGRGITRLALVGTLVGVGIATLFASSGPAGADPGLTLGALSVTRWT